MASSRVDTVCDLVAAAIVAALPTNDDTVVSSTEPTPTILDPEYLDSIKTRFVWVLADGYSQISQVSKVKALAGYRVTVLVVSKFLEPGEPSDAFARQEKLWAQNQVYDILGVARSCPVAGYYCETAEVAEACAPDLLRKLKLFWSQLDFEFRAIE